MVKAAEKIEVSVFSFPSPFPPPPLIFDRGSVRPCPVKFVKFSKCLILQIMQYASVQCKTSFCLVNSEAWSCIMGVLLSRTVAHVYYIHVYVCMKCYTFLYRHVH